MRASPTVGRWWPVAVVGAVTAVTVAGNLWWISAQRRGLPFDVDEAGYLQRAVRNADALHAGGIGRLVEVVRQPDPQAPLLPVIAGVVRYFTGAGPTALLGVEAMFSVVLIVATYLAARRVTSRPWAVTAAVVVACLPGVVDNGRQFAFALPAAAMVTVVLAAQLWAGDYSSTGRSLVWGALVGLAALTRTMVLGLLAALVLALLVRLLADLVTARSTAEAVPEPTEPRPGSRARPFVNAGAGLAVGVVLASTWYSASWHAVARYLTSYGYGAQATSYGAVRPVGSWSWWTFRFSRVLGTSVLWPSAMALGACLVVGAAVVVIRRFRRPPAAPPDVTPKGRPGRVAVAEHLARPLATLVVFVAVGYLLLSSTRNNGSSFELPLVPAAVVLVTAAVSRAPTRAWQLAAAACVVAASVAYAGQSGVIPANDSVLRPLAVGPVSMPLLDSRGSLMRYAQLEFGGCPSVVECMHVPPPTTDVSYLQAWAAAGDDGAGLLNAAAHARGRDPVVFFAVQDPFFNTNTVDLSYQLAFHRALPTGLLRSPGVAGASLEQQLDEPEFGQPNLVIVGAASDGPRSHEFSPQPDPAPVIAALQATGFSPIDSLPLPDGRVMELWWKDRGPAVEG